MTPEAIVRALAAADPLTDDQGCQFCGRDIEGSEVFGRGAEPHEPDCPWRLAVEWCAAEDTREANMAATRALADKALGWLVDPRAPGGRPRQATEGGEG